MLDDTPRQPGELLEKTRTLVNRRQFFFGAALVGALGFSQFRMPELKTKAVSKKLFESWFPNNVGRWSFATASGVVVPPPDALSDRLYDHVVTRVYQAPNLPVVMIAIAYNNAQDGVVQLHRPEVCYPAGGYSLSPTLSSSVKALSRRVPVNVFTATGPSRTEQVLYWTRIGQEYPLTWSEQKLSIMRANLVGYIPDGILVRVSLIGENQEEAKKILELFIQQFEKASAVPLQKIMLG